MAIISFNNWVSADQISRGQKANAFALPKKKKKTQGLGVHCIKLSGLLPWSLVIGLWCHIMWGQTIWVRGGPLAEPPEQSGHKLS